MNADFPVTEKVSIHCSVASKTVVLFAPFLSTTVGEWRGVSREGEKNLAVPVARTPSPDANLMF